MRILLIQVLLIATVGTVALRLLLRGGARTQALRRVGLVVFAAFAIWSILFPTVWNEIANFLGVGRGTDMVLYALVVAFISSLLTTYLRFRDLERRVTVLARRIALDEARRRPPDTGPPRTAEQESAQRRTGHQPHVEDVTGEVP